MAEPAARNHVRTGLLVVLAALAAFLAASIIPRLPWTPMNRYRFEVDLATGVGALGPGSTVIVAGLEEGTVLSTTPVSRRDAGDPTAPPIEVVEVEIEVRSSLSLFEGATARLVSPPIGAGTNVEIIDAFESGRPPLEADARLAWAPSPGLPATLLGEERWKLLEQSWSRLEQFGSLVPKWRDEIRAEFEGIRGEVQGIRGEVETDLERWRGSWETLREVPTQARADFERLRESGTAIQTDWATMQQHFDGMSSNLKGTIPAGGGNVEQLSILDRFSGVEGLEEAIASIRLTWSGLVSSWDRITAAVGGPWDWARLDLRLFLANFSIASSQFDRLFEEVLRHPVKTILMVIGVELGVIPDHRSIEQLKTDAVVRNFVRSVEDLRAAQQSLIDWIAIRPTVPEAPEIPDEIREAIETAEARMQQAADAVFRRRMMGR